jgi:hypothetical protein
MPVQISKQIRDKLAYAALNRLRRELGVLGQDVSIENVLFVAKNGDDGSAVPGSITHKYDTIQAAVTAGAAVPGSVVFIGPGVYDESVTIPDGTVDLAIVGMDRMSTFIEPAPQAPALVFAPTQQARLLSISGLSLGGAIDDPAPLMHIDGTAVVGALFAAGQFLMRDVLIRNAGTGPSLTFESAGNLDIRDVDVESDVTGPATYSTQLHECSGMLTDCDVSHCSARWNAVGAPVPSSNQLRLTDCTGSLTVINLAEIELSGGNYEGSALLGIDALLLQAIDNATHVGRVVADGTRFASAVTLDAGYDFVAAPPTNEQSTFANCSFTDELLTTNSNLGGTRHGPVLKSCVFADGVSAGDECDVDIRGSTFEQGLLAFVGDGTIDRDTVRLAGCEIPAGPGYGAIGPVAPLIPSLGGAPLPTYAAGLYGVLVEPNLLDASVTWNIDPAGKTGTTIAGQGFIAGVAGQILADIVIVRR